MSASIFPSDTQMSLPIVAAPRLFSPGPESGWCQRWDRGQHRWRHRSEGGFDRRRYDVQPIPDDTTARRFILEHHYSASYLAASKRYGMFEGSKLVGVAVLSVPVQAKVVTSVFPELVAYEESLELGRFVLVDEVPACGESWFLARVFEQAAKEGIRGVVSFSDPVPRVGESGAVIFPGHVGTIYQASNAVAVGRGTARWLKVLPTGQVLNERSLSKLRSGEVGQDYVERQLVAAGARPRAPEQPPEEWLRQAYREAGVRRYFHQGCHRYAFAIGPRRRLVILGLAPTPYPKRSDPVPAAA